MPVYERMILCTRKASCVTLPVSFKLFIIHALSSSSCYSRRTFSVFPFLFRRVQVASIRQFDLVTSLLNPSISAEGVFPDYQWTAWSLLNTGGPFTLLFSRPSSFWSLYLVCAYDTKATNPDPFLPLNSGSLQRLTSIPSNFIQPYISVLHNG